jgi:hypothetical protein
MEAHALGRRRCRKEEGERRCFFYAGSVGGWLGMQDEWIREGVSVEVMEKRRKK